MDKELKKNSMVNQRDVDRFDKSAKNAKATWLSCEYNMEHLNCGFIENALKFDVEQVEICYIDSERKKYILNEHHNSFSEIRVLFASGQRMLIGYKLLDEDTMRYCSWGYKKSSATTEKLFVYFKTRHSAYMSYIDAQNPEYLFMLSDFGKNIENLYNFIKNYTKEC